MTAADKKEALRKAQRDFKNTVQVARSAYREKVRLVIKKSDEKKAETIKKKI